MPALVLLLAVACRPAVPGTPVDGGSSLDAGPCEVPTLLQLGTPADDIAVSVGTDGNCGVFVAGQTRGVLADGPRRGQAQDLFLGRVGLAGFQWLEQSGSTGDDFVRDLGVSSDGTVYVVGGVEGALPGQTALGGRDLFVSATLADGTLRWVAQRGSPELDTGIDVIVLSDGQLAVTGATQQDMSAGYDILFEQWSDEAMPLVVRHFGLGGDDAPFHQELGEGLALDPSGDLFLVGSANGPFAGTHAGSTDAFVMRLSPAGDIRWRQQVGTSDIDAALEVVTDGQGRIYVLAVSTSNLETGAFENDGRQSPFLLAFTSDGHLLWIRRLATGQEHSRATALVLAPDGTVFVAGFTEGALVGANEGGRDAFVTRVNADGARVWSRQFGTAENDEALGLALTPAGDLLLVGSTAGSLVPSAHQGGLDAFLVRFPAAELGAP